MARTTQPVDVDTEPIAYRFVGDGDETILFLHGLGASRTSWDPQLMEFAERYRCIAWDAPGYGASPAAIDPGFADYAHAVAGLLDVVGIEKATVVGLSFGGQIALHLALRHPQLVERLILADTSAAFGGDGTDVDEWKKLRLGPLKSGMTPADMAETVITGVGGVGLTGERLRSAVESMGRITSDGLRAAVECLPSHDVRSRLAEITQPTLVLVGSLDTETPLAYAEELAGEMPNASLDVIDGAGHLTPIERPDEFNRLLREFLEA
ncbi:MAG: alpha/beta hydrolase [Acidimicrobiales bacterium]